MVTTAMGLIANMSLMSHITEKVPRSMCGFLAFLFIAAPSNAASDLGSTPKLGVCVGVCLCLCLCL